MIIKEAFDSFLGEFGFDSGKIHVSGRYYRASFNSDKYELTVSSEPENDQVVVLLSRHENQSLAALDDPKKTPRLSDLNEKYMGQISSIERKDNEAFFSGVLAENLSQKKLLKCAKDLKLVLPRYFYSN